MAETKAADPQPEERARAVADDKSNDIRLQLALEGCTHSMLVVARNYLSEPLRQQSVARELGFHWLLRAAGAGSKAAVSGLIYHRGICPPPMRSYVDDVIERHSAGELPVGRTDERASGYSRRIASSFKKIYPGADEERVARGVFDLITGRAPACESPLSRCCEDPFGNLIALALTVLVAGLVGLHYVSAFDRLVSRRLASMVDAFSAFLCGLLLIVGVRTYSTLCLCGRYSEVMALEARGGPPPFRRRARWTQLKLHLLSLLCATSMVGLCALSSRRVSPTVFSCAAYLISLADAVQQLSGGRMPGRRVGRYSLVLKLVSIGCMSCLFSVSRSRWQDTLVTLGMAVVACGLVFLLKNCSLFTFALFTCELSPILQGLFALANLLFLLLRSVTHAAPRGVRTLLVLLLISCALRQAPPGLLLPPRHVTVQDIYSTCRSTPTLNGMVLCSRLEGMRLNSTVYLSSIRLISRTNLQESLGLGTRSLDDGLVQLGVDSFEKLEVEVELTNSYFTAQAVLDDDAKELLRQLRLNDYVAVDGVIESARRGPELRLAVHAIEYNGQYLELKRLGSAVRQFWEHTQNALAGWVGHLSSSRAPSSFGWDDEL